MIRLALVVLALTSAYFAAQGLKDLQAEMNERTSKITSTIEKNGL